jgi:ubiquinone/menaquinone biosynthesis C-methylase UbiE
LASAVSPHVKTVYAVDVSRGVLECARILNSQKNTTYLHTDELGKIRDGSLDLVYSFAVIQHVTDQIFDRILEKAYRLLKENGRLVFHIIVEQQSLQNESDWTNDQSIRAVYTGQVKA